MKLPDKIYDVLKWIAMICLDAIGSLYNGLAQLWGWPYGVEVMQTCALLSVFLGALIGISTAQYNKENHL